MHHDIRYMRDPDPGIFTIAAATDDRIMDKEPSGFMSKFWRGLTWTRSSQNDLGSVNLYKYKKLRASTTIRLIQICPEKVKGCIACKIHDVDEVERPHHGYEALSYLWGNSQSTRRIFLKDAKYRWRAFPLHENLWQFLNHAWEQRCFNRLFWIDRLCLNQDNHDEISQQVPRMHTIYQSASDVLIWLNLKEAEERYLLELLGLYYQLRHRTPEMLHEIEQRRASFDEGIFLALFQNPYWNRIWIVQEVIMPLDVHVICRDFLIPLEGLARVLRWFWESRTYGKPPITALCDMRDEHGKWPLSRILIEFSGYQSSRPADRVYGMLGMVDDNDDGSSPTNNIQVDYDKPVPHVFLDAIFESSPALPGYTRLVQCLGDWNTFDSHALLGGYITDNKTSQRHTTFARLARETLEAFNIIGSVPDAPGEEIMAAITHNIFSCEYWVSVPQLSHEYRDSAHYLFPKLPLEQHAAMVGLALARSSRGPLGRWTARRQSRGEAPSPWRCAAHRSISIHRTGPSSYRSIFRTTPSGLWTREGVVKACGEQSQTCDGSLMTFEIPQVGLRLALSILNDEESLDLRLSAGAISGAEQRYDGDIYIHSTEEAARLSK